MTDPTGGGYGALDWLGIEDRCLAACVAAKTVVVDRLYGRGQNSEFAPNIVILPHHLSLERFLSMFKSLQHFSMRETYATPLNPDGSYRHRWPRWMPLEYSVDVHERSVPPDRFFSYRGEWPLCDGSYDGSSTETTWEEDY